ARSRGTELLNRKRVTSGGRIVSPAHIQHRRTGLVIPALELSEVESGGILHGLDEFFGAYRLAIVALEVQIHAFAKFNGSDQRMDHPHQLRALLVHGGGVEV